ncbi:hypothetical protein BDR07DRAFT_638110 [Suillus spraguei]|nr:hypothetical protein BDR07DRAFT_638110 [Suillus spraguei]
MSSQRSADPWPLSHSPQHLSNTQTPPNIPSPTPISRPGESKETLLQYSSIRAGSVELLENDLLLSPFARDHLMQMNRKKLKSMTSYLTNQTGMAYMLTIGQLKVTQSRQSPFLLSVTEPLKGDNGLLPECLVRFSRI